jgi:hypothetical protein
MEEALGWASEIRGRLRCAPWCGTPQERDHEAELGSEGDREDFSASKRSRPPRPAAPVGGAPACRRLCLRRLHARRARRGPRLPGVDPGDESHPRPRQVAVPERRGSPSLDSPRCRPLSGVRASSQGGVTARPA